MSFGVSPKTAILGVNLFCGATIPVFVFWLLLKLKMERAVALSVACLIMVFPLLVEISTQLIREPLCLFFLFSSATFIAYAAPRKCSHFATYGFFAAFFAFCGCFVRAEAVIAAGLLTLVWLFRIISSKRVLTGIIAWGSGAAFLLVIILLNYPPSKVFLFFTERMTGVLR
jgi:hypothetical protein